MTLGNETSVTYAPERIISSHPVTVSVHALISEQLAQIERQQQVSILFACESGSRGWGFASPDSDYDVRFIYVPHLPWYMQVQPGRDVIELPINAELDINGWELRKALGLLRESNPTLCEWLDSPIVYQQVQPWTQRLHALARQYFSPVRAYHHYVSMAKKNLYSHLQGEIIRHKKYFYSLRPLLAARWIRQRNNLPPMRFAELASHMLDDPALIDEINALLAIKMQVAESDSGPRRNRLHDFIESELEQAQDFYPQSMLKMSTAPLDTFLYEAVLYFSDLNKSTD